MHKHEAVTRLYEAIRDALQSRTAGGKTDAECKAEAYSWISDGGKHDARSMYRYMQDPRADTTARIIPDRKLRELVAAARKRRIEIPADVDIDALEPYNGDRPAVVAGASANRFESRAARGCHGT